MDVFSLGCVLAELWMEGTPPFTLSQLFKYREGEYNLESYLAEIEDVEIRVRPLDAPLPTLVAAPPLTRVSHSHSRAPQSLIRSMVSLDPAARLSFADYLTQYRSTAFPDIFYTFLHPFLSSLNEPSSPSPAPAPAPPPPAAPPRPGTNTPVDAAGQQQQQQTLLRTDATTASRGCGASGK